MLGRLHETGTNYKTGDSWSYITFTSRLFNILLLTFLTGNQFTPVNSEYTNVELYCSKKIISFIQRSSGDLLIFAAQQLKMVQSLTLIQAPEYSIEATSTSFFC